jgi:hypothetical protein
MESWLDKIGVGCISCNINRWTETCTDINQEDDYLGSSNGVWELYIISTTKRHVYNICERGSML